MAVLTHALYYNCLLLAGAALAWFCAAAAQLRVGARMDAAALRVRKEAL